MAALLYLLRILLSGTPESCIATQFGQPGDKWAGGNALLLKRPVSSVDLGIAHRTRPLGSFVVVQNVATSQIAVGRVIDRGPYGADLEGSWVLKRHRSEPGKWRGCVDLTPALGQAIGHNGREPVRLWVVE